MDYLGVHVSAAGGISKAVARAAALDTNVMQVMTAVPNRWITKPLEQSEVEAFRRERANHGIVFVVSHEAHLPNRATPDPVLLEKSVRALREEIVRCNLLGINALCIHPGSATDGDFRRGIRQEAGVVAGALAESDGRLSILLELTAGGGSQLGSTIEEIAQYLDSMPSSVLDRIGVAFDTCHMWARDYPLEELERVLDKTEQLLGPNRLGLIHMNDSVGVRGSRRDRHANIGEGTIPLEIFADIMNCPRLTRVPKILETPKGDDAEASDRRNLALLRSLVQSFQTLPQANRDEVQQ